MDMVLAADPATWTGMELMLVTAEVNYPYQTQHYHCCQEHMDSASFY